MRKTLTLGILALALLAAPVLAAPTVTLSGGLPYTVNIVNTGDASWWNSYGITTGFKTFCVENGTFFTPGVTYRATIDDAVLTGTTKPQLTDYTKKIYAAFLNGELTGTGASAIQNAVWDSLNPPSINPLALLAGKNVNGWERVKVLNLWALDGTDAQSQLVQVVPAPGAILLAGIGTSLVGWMRRRRAM